MDKFTTNYFWLLLFLSLIFFQLYLKVFKVLNEVYKVFDERIKYFDVYKVESINEKYMVASGVPSTNGTSIFELILDNFIDLSTMQSNFIVSW